MTAVRRLAAGIDTFVEQAGALWRSYHDLGPGKLSPADWNAVSSAASAIASDLGDPDVARWFEQAECAIFPADELQTLVRELTRLARACACTPQGLNFITGEAGLIPRKDQHRAFESGLVKLDQMAADLRGQC
jgi:hypothetical protein